MNKERLFMRAGRTNQEDRDNFIKFWAEYMDSVSDREWSSQQAMLINSQIKGADHETYLKMRKLRSLKKI